LRGPQSTQEAAKLSQFERLHLPSGLTILLEVALGSESVPLRDFASAQLTAYREEALYQAALQASNVCCEHFVEATLVQLASDMMYAAQTSRVAASLLERMRREKARPDSA